RWTKPYLDVAGGALTPKAIDTPAKIQYVATGPGVLFSMTLDRPTEITGPLAAKLFISSSTTDADLSLVLRVFDPGGKELTFMGSTDPNTPIANGWLRASHWHVLAADPPGRPRRATGARRRLRMRRGDPADVDRATRRLARGAERTRPRLRIRGRVVGIR